MGGKEEGGRNRETGREEKRIGGKEEGEKK